MNRSTDVAIVGGGVIGSAIAYFLLADGAFDGRVTIIERDPTYARASSALSASSIRQQFSTPENIRMSRFGADFLRDIDRRLGLREPASRPIDVGLTEAGYLYLATPAGEADLRPTAPSSEPRARTRHSSGLTPWRHHSLGLRWTASP